VGRWDASVNGNGVSRVVVWQPQMRHDGFKRCRSQTPLLQTSCLTSATHRSGGNSRQSMLAMDAGVVSRSGSLSERRLLSRHFTQEYPS